MDQQELERNLSMMRILPFKILDEMKRWQIKEFGKQSATDFIRLIATKGRFRELLQEIDILVKQKSSSGEQYENFLWGCVIYFLYQNM